MESKRGTAAPPSRRMSACARAVPAVPGRSPPSDGEASRRTDRQDSFLPTQQPSHHLEAGSQNSLQPVQDPVLRGRPASGWRLACARPISSGP